MPPGGIPAAPLAASFCPQPVISGTDTLKHKTASAPRRGTAYTGVFLSNKKVILSRVSVLTTHHITAPAAVPKTNNPPQAPSSPFSHFRYISHNYKRLACHAPIEAQLH